MPDEEWRPIEGVRELNEMCHLNRDKGFKLTNLIVGNRRVWHAAESGLVYTRKNNPGSLMLFRDAGVQRVYYTQKSWEDVTGVISESLTSFDEMTVIDVMTGTKNKSFHDSIFSQVQFAPYKSFRRMSRPGQGLIFPDTDIEISRAHAPESDAISRFINDMFDPLAEFLPDMEELARLVVEQGVFTAIDSRGTMVGLLIHEQTGKTSNLRYIAVAPHAQGGGIGTAMIARYLSETCDAVRHDLWVWDQNQVAIKRYQKFHYTFQSHINAIYRFKDTK